MTEVASFAKNLVIPIVVVVLAIAVYTDCRWRLIYNTLTIPAIAVGLLLNYLIAGWPGLIFGLMGFGAGLGLMLIPFYFGQMGGGDVKLMASLGSFLGAYPVLNVFLFTMLAGGALAIAIAAYRRKGNSTLLRTGHLVKQMFSFQKTEGESSEQEPAMTMPYGPAIALGAFLYLSFGNVV